MKRAILIGSLALWSVLAFALPSTQDVDAAVRSGDYPRAEQLMREVVAAKPQSAKAHYYFAEILAKEQKYDDAAGQVRAARQADPAITFTDPAKFRSFEQELQRAQGGSTAVAPQAGERALPPQHASGGVPGWVWAVGLAFVAFLVLRAAMRRLGNGLGGGGGGYVPQASYPGAGYGQGGGFGPGYGGAPSAGGSALRTGLAAAGGLAAGMALEKYLDRDEHGNVVSSGDNNFQQNWNGGDEAEARRELADRPFDAGNGGGWDDGGATGFDPGGGGSGSDDGGW